MCLNCKCWTASVQSLAKLTFVTLLLIVMTTTSGRTESELEKYFSDPFSTSFVNMRSHEFHDVINPRDKVCERDDVFLVIYIHSAPDHFSRRTTIRKSWGDVSYYNVTVRRVFILGLPSPSTPGTSGDDVIQDRIGTEAVEHGDIVQMDFVDSYYNLTYKAVSALKWISRYCSRTRFVMKADDDAFVNLFTVLNNLTSIVVKQSDKTQPGWAYADDANSSSRGLLLCNLWSREAVARTGKWKLSESVWSIRTWPDFCQGIAFVMSIDVVLAMHNASYHVPFLWLDDVYITGFVPLRLRDVRRLGYNERYSSRSDSMEFRDMLFMEPNWPTYMFFHVKNPDEVESFWARIVSTRNGRHFSMISSSLARSIARSELAVILMGLLAVGILYKCYKLIHVCAKWVVYRFARVFSSYR